MDYNIQNDDTVIDLSRLIKVMISRWRFVIIFAIIGAVLSTLPTLHGLLKIKSDSMDEPPIEKEENITPIYESSTLMEIRLPEENDEQAKAIVELAKSNTVLKKVIDSMKLEISIANLKRMISASGSLNSNRTTLEIKASNKDPDLARRIADCLRDHVRIFINNSMQIESFRIIQQANLPNEPKFEDIVQNIDENDNESGNEYTNLTISLIKQLILGTMLGIFLSLFIIFIQFVLNDKIQTVDDVERYLGKRVLASIPMYDKGKK